MRFKPGHWFREEHGHAQEQLPLLRHGSNGQRKSNPHVQLVKRDATQQLKALSAKTAPLGSSTSPTTPGGTVKRRGESFYRSAAMLRSREVHSLTQIGQLFARTPDVLLGSPVGCINRQTPAIGGGVGCSVAFQQTASPTNQAAVSSLSITVDIHSSCPPSGGNPELRMLSESAIGLAAHYS